MLRQRDDDSSVLFEDYLNPSRTNIESQFGRMVQLMCDARRRSSGASVCELCDDPCDDPAAIECARIAMALGARHE